MNYQLAKGVNIEEADGTLVFLKDDGDAAVVDAMGAVIARGLVGGSVKTCTELIEQSYDVSVQQAHIDVMEFAEELVGKGLLEPVA